MTEANYAELTELYGKHASAGLEILGFPCNQFGSQEPGSMAEIKAFAAARGAKYPIFDKVDVNGANQAPLYAYLQKELGSFPSADVKWNFGKFLVDGNGSPVKRYAPTDSPMSIEKDILKLL